MRAGLKASYAWVNQDMLDAVTQPQWKSMLYALCFMHTIVQERRKFGPLGFNIPYEFNQSDLSACVTFMQNHLNDMETKKRPVDWIVINYMVCMVQYGGRITDDWDRRLVNVYIAQFFCDNAIDIPGFPLSSLPEYYIPPDGPLGSYKDQIRCMPLTDLPAAFGQHANADISSMIEDSNEFFVTVSSLMASGAGASDDEAAARVLSLAKGLEEQTPPSWDLRAVRKSFESRSDPDPLKTVLFQELDRYNKLLKNLKRDTQHAVLDAAKAVNIPAGVRESESITRF